MFDARSILDILLGGQGARSGQGHPRGATVFKDMLDQLGDQPAAGRQTAPQPTLGGRSSEPSDPQAQPGSAGQPTPPAPTGGSGGGMSLEDLLRSMLTGGQAPGGSRPPQGPAATETGGQQPGPAIPPEVSNELQDLLRQILQGGAGQGAGLGGGATLPVNRLTGDDAPATGGGFAEALRELLGQATSGAREGAARIDEATGLSGRAREALGQLTGESPEEAVAKLRKLIADNQVAAGAALGGLGALVLGTRAGRSLAATAVRLGSLALVGGLAYKAYQRYQQGQPPSSRPGEKQALLPAPEGSGFEPGAVTHDAARLYVRAMIAAAAADGRIDAAEQQKILGALKQAGIEDSAQEFLAAEISNPATVAELAEGVSSPEEAVQVYTAARIAVDPDTDQEHAFLASLAQALGIDDELAAQVDAAARSTAP